MVEKYCISGRSDYFYEVREDECTPNWIIYVFLLCQNIRTLFVNSTRLFPYQCTRNLASFKNRQIILGTVQSGTASSTIIKLMRLYDYPGGCLIWHVTIYKSFLTQLYSHVRAISQKTKHAKPCKIILSHSNYVF